MQTSTTEVFYGSFEHPFFKYQPLYVAATTRGLCRITWPHDSFDTLPAWVAKQIVGAVLVEDQEKVSEFIRQLQEYFDGDRNTFTLPFDLRGTRFQTAVWQALVNIPYGETRSYSDIADAVGSSGAVRAVGMANGANPIPIIVPCHRVIGKNGTLTGFRGGLQMKQQLLQLEGFGEHAKQ